MLINDLTIYTTETVTVGGTTAAFRDELIACQHPTEDYGDAVHMDGDYVFDASLDESLNANTRLVMRYLVNEYPNAYLFVFNP